MKEIIEFNALAGSFGLCYILFQNSRFKLLDLVNAKI